MSEQRNIPFFNYPALFMSHEDEYMGVIRDVCRRGAYILQKDLREFEEHLKEFLNVKYAFGVSDGTNAMVIGLRAMGIGAGDEVILPSHTYVATAASVAMVGAIPVPCDIGPDNLIDPASVEAAITERTKLIMPVHVNGRTCDMAALRAVADRHGLAIAEDAAQALGSSFQGRKAGTFGVFGTFSFYPAKVLGCFGDGGAVVTNDDEIGARLALLRDHGRDDSGEVVAWGTNSRLDNLQAAILDHKLKTFPQDLERRREVARRYHAVFSEMKEITPPPGPDEAGTERYDTYQNYEMAADRRDELRVWLKERGIGSIIQWAGTPIHKFSKLGFTQILPATDRFFERCLMLPMNVTLSDDDVDYVCAAVREFYRR